MANFADLGRRILRSNPYKAKPNLNLLAAKAKAGDQPLEERYQLMLEEIEADNYYEGTWHFKNAEYRVKKALRIPYRYFDEDGLPVQDYLLIGYEGSGPG